MLETSVIIYNDQKLNKMWIDCKGDISICHLNDIYEILHYGGKQLLYGKGYMKDKANAMSQLCDT